MAKAVVVDNNGLGAGLIDELLKVSFDLETGRRLGCWNTMNSEHTPEEPDAEPCVYALMPQAVNNAVIVNFIGLVESGKLRLLVKKGNEEYDLSAYENQEEEILPFVLTDLLIDEIGNLKTRTLSSGQLAVDQVITKMNKDKYSALSYGLWYAKTYEDMCYRSELLTDILSAVVF